MKEEKNLLSRRLFQLRTKMAKSQAEMASLMDMKQRMYQLYEAGEYDKTEGDSRKQKRLLRLEELEQQYLAKLTQLSQAEPAQKGTANDLQADMQRQIDELTGKLKRVMDRLGMN